MFQLSNMDETALAEIPATPAVYFKNVRNSDNSGEYPVLANPTRRLPFAARGRAHRHTFSRF